MAFKELSVYLFTFTFELPLLLLLRVVVGFIAAPLVIFSFGFFFALCQLTDSDSDSGLVVTLAPVTPPAGSLLSLKWRLASSRSALSALLHAHSLQPYSQFHAKLRPPKAVVLDGWPLTLRALSANLICASWQQRETSLQLPHRLSICRGVAALLWEYQTKTDGRTDSLIEKCHRGNDCGSIELNCSVYRSASSFIDTFERRRFTQAVQSCQGIKGK